MNRCTPKSGFTLIEMLVAVTLVLLMMVMFAEMFSLAGGTVNKQRAMADNDQNARTFATIIRADLDKRSFRTVVPYFAGELAANPGTPFNPRRGYFYISCNNLLDRTDDVLQFTVLSTVSLRNSDETQYFGRAAPLYAGAPATPGLNFLANPNQPDRDDGQITTNDAGASRGAEICYFMRGTRLYRRVMLLRDPIPAAGVVATSPDQPTTAAGLDYFASANMIYPAASNFWGQFDFSAYRTPTVVNSSAGTPICARFAGLDFLRNDTPVAFVGLPFCYSLGQSWNRFGHNHEIYGAAAPYPAGNPLYNGLPREFSSNTAPNFFIGRFTHEETSHAAFRYPQWLSTIGNGNPMDAAPAGNALSDAAPYDGVVDEYAGGSRTGVDLLLANVHEFRVEVWDQRLNDFAPIGHSLSFGGVVGDYNVARRLNPTYGPLGGTANIFDTWHPLFNRNANTEDTNSNGILDLGEDLNGNGAIDPILGDIPDRPPYRPLNIDPTGVSGPAVTNPSGAGLYWARNTTYQVGDVVFPRMEDLNGNGYFDLPAEDGANGFPSSGAFPGNGLDRRLSEDVNGNNIIDAGESDGSFGFPADGAINSTFPPFFPFGLTFSYRCIRGGISGVFSDDEPNLGTWSTTTGQIIRGRRNRTEDRNGDSLLQAWEDLNGNMAIDPLPDEPDWIVEYNVRPLRAIRITVRFEHPTSRQMRQVTIVHSLRDTTAVP